jgi:hypothetical protein
MGAQADVNLYRASASVLKTDNHFSVAGDITAGASQLNLLSELLALRGVHLFLVVRPVLPAP